MLRDKNLVPLSRQHQHALALCVRLDRAIQAGGVDLEAWQAEIQQIFEQEITFHFAAEEKELFFDIEVDPLRDFCYLHGFVERCRGNNQTERFVSFFAETITPDAEEREFANAVRYMQQARPCAIYYYSKYERTIYQFLNMLQV